MFERSYQPVQMAVKQPDIAYGEKAKKDEHLWSAVSNAFLRRNSNAPLYVTQEDLNRFEARDNIIQLRKQLKATKE